MLISYWSAIENTTSVITISRSKSFNWPAIYERRVLDKAADHFSQAADFYDNYESSPMSPILKRMGDIYYHQGKYNLALVHYFNAIDHERLQNNIENVVDIRLASLLPI